MVLALSQGSVLAVGPRDEVLARLRAGAPGSASAMGHGGGSGLAGGLAA
jgi:hypothetical protein